MLVNLKDILKIAEDKSIAIGCFNAPDLSCLRAVVRAAEEMGQPVVITHAQLHEEKGLCTMDEVAPIILWYAKKANVPICVHLDHGTTLDYIARGLDIGFTSVMYDGSELPLEDNIANTKKVVAMAKQYGASVEAELGSMGARGGGFGGATTASDDDKRVSIYTEPDDAADFVKQTGVDALACAFGTAHGFYNTVPKLDFERVSAIRKAIGGLPIVMHGGSGVTDEDYAKVVARGVRKVNYYTYMAKAGAEAVSNRQYTQFHDVLKDAEAAMKENVKAAIKLFSAKR
ncbi:MAG: class II fructose-bisphosphate aldolase [Clostridia bacterium]|nr:class II fructose-bisphosphate aldolase [Clostridia bacterium]